jgi:predicted adenine nucleotide alpha hydrolase (AANH) superfamily ATPase
MSCCAPCSGGAIAELALRGVDFIVLFYNPNIYPHSEYKKRLDEQIRHCEEIGVKYAVGEWDHGAWLKRMAGMESAPERGPRCAECFKHRFEFGQRFAIENGYNAVASVFGVSRHKDQNQVDEAARGVLTKVAYPPVEWNENSRSEINKKAGFYRQNYCGCEFSFHKV